MSFYCLKIWHRTFSWSVSRPAEVQPWEVRSAHPCRARARHPIHKAMGGHACPKQTVLRKRFIRYNLTRESHSVPDKTIERNKFSVLRVVYCLFQEKQGRNATMWTASAPRIRTLQQAPFADFAAEDLVQRSHGRAGGGGFEEAEETWGCGCC